MTVFISGGAKCGKSSLAQSLAVELAKGGNRYYVATLIPSGEEDDDRIRRHIADRDGLGFETVECFRNLLSIVRPEGTFLVDSVTSLLQNAMFPAEQNYRLDLAAAERCGEELVQFTKSVRNAVFVSDYIYSDAQHYSESTEQYRKCLAGIDRRLAKACDVVIEVSSGQAIFHKGELEL